MKWLLILTAVVLVLFGAGVMFLAREAPVPEFTIPDDATAVLEDPRFALPQGWAWEQLESGGGTVRWGHTQPEDARGVVLFLPGYSAPLELYFEAFSIMREAGYAVVAMDWPAQGASSRGTENPQKIHATSRLDGHVAAAEAISREMDRRFAGMPRFAVGLSMGAQLGTRLVSGSGRFQAAALITPAYGLANGRPSGAELFLLRTLNALGFGARYAPGATDWTFDMDAHTGAASECSLPNERTKLFSACMVATERIKVGGMINALAMAMIESGRFASSDAVLDGVTIPVWMPLAEDDRFVDNAVASAACGQLRDCELKVYAEARHCLFEEADDWYQPFMTDLVAFLDSHVEPVTP
ncbi:MAG: alpha/beta hydrolase, partial [Pseudomonadota bacterium]